MYFRADIVAKGGSEKRPCRKPQAKATKYSHLVNGIRECEAILNFEITSQLLGVRVGFSMYHDNFSSEFIQEFLRRCDGHVMVPDIPIDRSAVHNQ